VAGEASGAAVAEADLMDDEVEPVDELAIDAARDYCETCGKFTDGETCVACGSEDWERVVARLPLPVSVWDVVTLRDGRRGVVETVKVADDLLDAKCVIRVES
jgi:hypothetical protein